MEYVSRTQHYQKVKKPLIERQRRARINKCLDSLKQIIAEFQSDEAILRMDKAEMLETTIAFLRHSKAVGRPRHQSTEVLTDSFRHGYMNAVNEVSRVLASTRGVTVEFGKSVMTHLGCQFNRLEGLHQQQKYQNTSTEGQQRSLNPLMIDTSPISAPLSPASSGYHSDMDSPVPSPCREDIQVPEIWRPW
ncbi:enhancer of split m8 protein [Episyrphus balteatus]|uniref:enhancer of split m8 protein n=1 Tax=Episyrphus balteatus TaxID=286459 RepID=UPI002485607E|nr:enhancer of split m8 protein [Episyrphus balteatus]